VITKKVSPITAPTATKSASRIRGAKNTREWIVCQEVCSPQGNPTPSVLRTVLLENGVLGRYSTKVMATRKLGSSDAKRGMTSPIAFKHEKHGVTATADRNNWVSLLLSRGLNSRFSWFCLDHLPGFANLCTENGFGFVS